MNARTYRLSVPSLDLDIPVAESQTLLEALEAAHADYPCGCTSGICGLCKSRLVSGRVELPDYCPAITEEERAAGLTLPCSATPLSDCVISPVDDGLLPKVENLEAEVVELRPLTHDMVAVILDPGEGARLIFLPGQYATLGFGDLPEREFSMASCPDDRLLQFYIRRVPGGLATQRILDSLAIGDRVRVAGPYGLAYLREAEIGPILAVAGGSGLAPVRSIVETALRRGMSQPIHLYFGVRGTRDLFEVERLKDLEASHPNLTVTFAFSEEETAEARTGHLHEVLAAEFAGRDLSDWRAYVAGPPVMVRAVAAVLGGLKLAEDRCHADPFLTKADKARADQRQKVEAS